MLEKAQIDWIVQLLAAGNLSHRRIARLTGISRGTVSAIANGKRAVDRVRQTPVEPCFTPGPPARCRGCGGMVYMPCLLCRVRAAANDSGRMIVDSDAETARANPALLECPAG